VQSIFLSYSYDPHPTLYVRTGENLGGGGLTATVQERIQSSDALVAVFLPHNRPGDVKLMSQWVSDEFAYAKAKGLFGLRIIHEDIKPEGMFNSEEYEVFKPNSAENCLLKLLKTIHDWKETIGQPLQLVVNSEAALRFDADKNHVCEYRLFQKPSPFERPKESEWQPAYTWKDQGAMYAYVRGVPKDNKVKLRIKMDGITLESDYQDPFGYIQLIQK
jgi:hypothetical protein